MGLTESTLAKAQLEALATQGKLEEGRPYGPHCPYELPLVPMIEAPPPRPGSSRVPPHMLQQLQQIPSRPPPEPSPWAGPMQPPPPPQQQQQQMVGAVVTSSGSSSGSPSAHQAHNRAPPSRAATYPLMSSEPLYNPAELRTIPYNQAPLQQVLIGAPQYRFYQPQYSVERTTLDDGHQQQQQQQHHMAYHNQTVQHPQHQQHHQQHQPIAPPSLQPPPPTLQVTPHSPINVEMDMQQQQQQHIRPSSSPAHVSELVPLAPGEVPQFLSPQARAAVFPPYLSPSAAPSLHMSPAPQPDLMLEQQEMPMGVERVQVYPTTTTTTPTSTLAPPSLPALTTRQGTGAHAFRSPDVPPPSLGGPVAGPRSVPACPTTPLGAPPTHYVGELGFVPRAYPTDGAVPTLTEDNHFVQHHGAPVGTTGAALTAAPDGGPGAARGRGSLLRAGSGAGRGSRAAPQQPIPDPPPFHAVPAQPRSTTADRYRIVPADRVRRESTGSIGFAGPAALRVMPPGMPMPFAAVVEGQDFRGGAIVAPSRRAVAALPLVAPRATRAVTCL